MKFSGKPILIIWVMFILAAPVFAIDVNDLQKNVASFAEDMSKSLPFYSTIGLNWSDANIGSFPHFGIGLSTGLTTMDNKSINKMMTSFGIPEIKKLPLIGNSRFPLPAYTIDARIGLPVIPVDFGFKFGYLFPKWGKSLIDIEIRNMLIGADVRYAVVNSKIIPIRFSVGLGFNHLNGGITYSAPSLNFTDTASGLNLDANKVDILWSTTNIELKMQVSFPFRIITPYAGAGIIYAFSSSAGYRASCLEKISDDDKKRLEKLDVTGTSTNNFETIYKYKNSFNTRVFGGLSFNLAYVRLDLTGMYEFLGKNFGATLGLRFQM